MAKMSADPTEMFNRLNNLGEDWADKNAAASLLEETAKPFLSRLIVSELSKGGAISAAEARARASPEYEAHVNKMVDARKEADKARVKYYAAQTWIDLQRSLMATRRVEMQNLGSHT